MSTDEAFIVGAFEHPTRKAPDKSTPLLHMESALGALADAGLSLSDVDGYFCAGDAPGLGAMSLIDYMNIRPRHIDTTELGGAAYVAHVAKAAQAIAAGKCDVALITLAGRPRSEQRGAGSPPQAGQPDSIWEAPYKPVVAANYALSAKRHMHEFGTTSEQLAWVRVAASVHASHNPHAMLRDRVTVEDVLASDMIADPLHKLDCCVISDGGGALVVTRREIAKGLARPLVKVKGAGHSVKGQNGGDIDLTHTGAVWSGPQAFAEAGVGPHDIKYASIYDSFTITVILQLEDLGFCAKGEGGRFVADGALISGVGRMPINTDGGGLCNNHPANRGGMTKVIEAVRQLRGEATPAVQVNDCDLALVQGTGGQLSSRHGSATLILERL